MERRVNRDQAGITLNENANMDVTLYTKFST